MCVCVCVEKISLTLATRVAAAGNSAKKAPQMVICISCICIIRVCVGEISLILAVRAAAAGNSGKIVSYISRRFLYI